MDINTIKEWLVINSYKPEIASLMPEKLLNEILMRDIAVFSIILIILIFVFVISLVLVWKRNKYGLENEIDIILLPCLVSGFCIILIGYIFLTAMISPNVYMAEYLISNFN